MSWGTPAYPTIRSGANINVVHTMAGHASATMTWDLYGHLYDDDLDSVAERLDVACADLLRSACGLSRTEAVSWSAWEVQKEALTRHDVHERP
jgi:hypothetical protein